MQQGVDPLTSIAALVHLVEGLPFAATLLFILTVHEFGHYFAARRWGVKASLPYFLPLPYVSFLGTLGAVIKIRSPIPNKRALLDIGAAGPLAGFVVALAACFAGLSRSAVVSADYFSLFPHRIGGTLAVFRHRRSRLARHWARPNGPLRPGGFCRLGRAVHHGLQPLSRWSTRRRSHRVRALWPRHRQIARTAYVALLALGIYGSYRCCGVGPKDGQGGSRWPFSSRFLARIILPPTTPLSRWIAAATSSATSAC